MADKKSIERAESYKSMMNLWAWKDFLEIMKHERQSALERGNDSDELKTVYVNKGYVKCIDSLMSELDTIVNPQ